MVANWRVTPGPAERSDRPWFASAMNYWKAGLNMNDGMSLLTVKEVAELLRISLAGGYELIQSGTLQSLRIGRNRGTIRVTRDDLQRYLDNCRLGPAVVRERRPKMRLKHIRV